MMRNVFFKIFEWERGLWDQNVKETMVYDIKRRHWSDKSRYSSPVIDIWKFMWNEFMRYDEVSPYF